MTTPRKHAALITQWANDRTTSVFWWNVHSEMWVIQGAYNPWHDQVICHVGHTAPTAPPVKMCQLAGVEFPEPMTEIPETNTEYWIALPFGCVSIRWCGSQNDYTNLRESAIQATEQGAKQFRAALIASTKQAVEHAK